MLVLVLSLPSIVLGFFETPKYWSWSWSWFWENQSQIHQVYIKVVNFKSHLWCCLCCHCLYRVGQKKRFPTLFCLYYCSICLDAQITYPVNWNSVVHILKPKLNLYVKSSFEILQQSQSTPNIIMSQWQNTRARCVLVSMWPLLVRKLFTNTFCTPSLFLTKEFNWRFIVVCETHTVYQQTVNDVIVTLHFVSCRVGSLQLFGSSDGTFENISTKFTHISQKWFYFTVLYTLYLHISLGRCNWLRCSGTVFIGSPCMWYYYSWPHFN